MGVDGRGLIVELIRVLLLMGSLGKRDNALFQFTDGICDIEAQPGKENTDEQLECLIRITLLYRF